MPLPHPSTFIDQVATRRCPHTSHVPSQSASRRQTPLQAGCMAVMMVQWPSIPPALSLAASMSLTFPSKKPSPFALCLEASLNQWHRNRHQNISKCSIKTDKTYFMKQLLCCTDQTGTSPSKAIPTWKKNHLLSLLPQGQQRLISTVTLWNSQFFFF